MQHLQLILEILFQLREDGEQSFSDLLLARCVVTTGEELLDLVAGVEHVELRIAVGTVVEGIRVTGVEVDEATYLLGVAVTDRA